MNELRDIGSNHSCGEDAIGLADVVEFLVAWWKLILGLGMAGALAALVYSYILPQQFQSRVLIVVAESPSRFLVKDLVGQTGAVGGNRHIESPGLLLARMKFPTTYPAGVVDRCEFSSQAKLLDALRDFSPDIQNGTFGFSVQHRSPELAIQCADALFKMIQSQQAELATMIIEGQSSVSPRVQVLTPGAPTRLAAPIHADGPVSPPKMRLVATWSAGGVFAGLLVALLWTGVTWYRRMAASQTLPTN